MLAGHELDSLWSTLPDTRRIAFLDTLSDEAAERLLAYQERQHAERLAAQEREQRTLAAQQAEAHPDGRRQLQPCDDQVLAERRARNLDAVNRHRAKLRAQQSASTD